MKKRIDSIPIPLFLAVVFFSGFSALIYQIVWIREFALLFGTHLLAASTILTIFMAGMAFGAKIFGSLSDRVKNPVHLFIFLQAGIAAFALSFPFLFKVLTKGYLLLNYSGSFLQNNPHISCFFLSTLLLIIPTLLIGGTLPVMVKIFSENRDFLGKKISSVYSLNNLGAFAGCLLAGFFLIRISGSAFTNLFAASLNIINVIILVILSRKIRIVKPDLQLRFPFDTTPTIPPSLLKIVLLVTAIEGFTMLVYEILWTRILLEFSYDKSTFLYTTVILGFLSGLFLGAWIIRRKIDNWNNLVIRFAFVEFFVGFLSLLSFMVFSLMAPELYNLRNIAGEWIFVSGKEYLFVFILTGIPAILMGISFPLAGKIITGNLSRVGSRMGLLSFTDTIGSVFGPFVAGFIMLRFLTIYESFVVCVLLNAGSALVLFLMVKKIKLSRRLSIALPLTSIMAVTFYFFTPAVYHHTKTMFFPGDKILEMKEGRTSTVTALQIPSRHLALAINGAKTAFTNSEDLRVHKMLAYLPWFFQPDAKNAMVIGYGMGVTLRCLSDLKINTELAELSPEVIQIANRYFTHQNHSVAFRDNVRLFAEDGRSLLQRSGRKYDIITTNAVHPRLGSNLYTKDFYELCLKHMHGNSTICQWLPTNWMSENEFKSLIRAFTDVFPNAYLWYANRAHTLLIGSPSEIKIDYARFNKLMMNKSVYYELMDVDLNNTESLLSCFFMTGTALAEYVSDVAPDTDDLPVIEYSFVTDPRPNKEILGKLLYSNPDFRKMISFPQAIQENDLNTILLLIQESFDHQISYLNGLKRDLEMIDKIEAAE